MLKDLRRKLRTLRGDDRGAALFEYALVLFVFAALIVFIATMSWWWWSQYVASTAIHDGVRTAGARYGDVAQGYQVAYGRLHVALGRQSADEYRDDMALWPDPTHRAVQGRIETARVVRAPFLDTGVFRVRVGSFQRRWMFYGGPPKDWE
jgi:Flp pilus assembly pilin Flp